MTPAWSLSLIIVNVPFVIGWDVWPMNRTVGIGQLVTVRLMAAGGEEGLCLNKCDGEPCNS